MRKSWLGVIVGLAIIVIGIVLLAPELFFPGQQPQEQAREQSPPEEAPSPQMQSEAQQPARAAREDETGSALQQEAEAYVRKLAEPSAEPLSVEHADNFVHPDRTLSLVTEESIEKTTPQQLFSDPSLSDDTPITIVKEVEQVENTTPERIIAESGGDMNKPVKVLEGGKVRETTVGEVLEQHKSQPKEPIKIVKSVPYFEKTTPGELKKDKSLPLDKPIRVIRTPYSLTMATVAQLLGVDKEVSADTIFYVRTVEPGDDQGIWGIVQHGLIDNFARGMAIRRGEKLDTYRVEIPENADERLPDNSSSFLGRLIDEKTKQSSVYNFKVGRMGKDPNLINPGQEIVIVSFTPDELVSIYKHFVNAYKG
jgi:hypothetical protein